MYDKFPGTVFIVFGGSPAPVGSQLAHRECSPAAGEDVFKIPIFLSDTFTFDVTSVEHRFLTFDDTAIFPVNLLAPVSIVFYNIVKFPFH